MHADAVIATHGLRGNNEIKDSGFGITMKERFSMISVGLFNPSDSNNILLQLTINGQFALGPATALRKNWRNLTMT